jgi:hypothetical protein
MLVKHSLYILYTWFVNGIVLAAVIGHEQPRRKGALIAPTDRRTLSVGRVRKMDDICNDSPCQIDHAAGVSRPHLTIDHCTTNEARVALNTMVKIEDFTCIFSDNLTALQFLADVVIRFQAWVHLTWLPGPGAESETDCFTPRCRLLHPAYQYHPPP